MSIFEYDKEEEERKLRKAEFEAGEQSGIQKGIQEGIQEGKELKTKEIVNLLLQADCILFFNEWLVQDLQSVCILNEFLSRL